MDPSATCTPRPPVGVSARLVSSSRLLVTVTAGTSASKSTNALLELRFGAASGAIINAGRQTSASGSMRVGLAPRTRVTTFYVTQATTGTPVMVPFDVVDECGEWPTFVGFAARPPVLPTRQPTATPAPPTPTSTAPPTSTPTPTASVPTPTPTPVCQSGAGSGGPGGGSQIVVSGCTPISRLLVVDGNGALIEVWSNGDAPTRLVARGGTRTGPEVPVTAGLLAAYEQIVPTIPLGARGLVYQSP